MTALLASALPWAAHCADTQSLIDLPLEALMEVRVSTASRVEQDARLAPSQVSVIDAVEIRRHGWRRLSEALESIPGLYVSDDRSYRKLGARGFLRDGDYSTRFLLLLDGIRVNDALYDQATIGDDFMLDLALVERIEFVPGPGSAVYGGNALLGVVNVITRRGDALDAAEVEGSVGSDGLRAGRASWGGRLGGVAVLMSASEYSDPGDDLYLPAFDTPEQNDGVAEDLDGVRTDRAFLRLDGRRWSSTLSHGERHKQVPTASYEQRFNDPGSWVEDHQTLASLSYRRTFGEDLDLTALLFGGEYRYEGRYVYDGEEDGQTVVNVDHALARWYGFDAFFATALGERHAVVAGVELRRDVDRDQRNEDLAPAWVYLDDQRDATRVGVYAQDEWRVHPMLRFNLGMRMDHDPVGGLQSSPRVAAILTPQPSTVVKLVHGRAHRSPNAFERYYDVEGEGGQRANPGLAAEHIVTTEFVVEHDAGRWGVAGVSLYRYDYDDLIVARIEADGMTRYVNDGAGFVQGVELSWRRRWADAELRGSYAYQYGEDVAYEARVPGIADGLFKLDAQGPRWPGGLRAAGSVRYIGERPTREPGENVDGSWWVDASVLRPGLFGGAGEIALTLSDLFDSAGAEPAGGEHLPLEIPRRGREWRVDLRWRF